MTGFTGDHDDFVEAILANVPDGWDGPEEGEDTAIRYVRALERVAAADPVALQVAITNDAPVSISGRCTLALNDADTVLIIHALIKSASTHMYRAEQPGCMHPGDYLVSARVDIRLARQVAGILEPHMIPSRLRVMERAITLALTRGTRYEGDK